MRGIRTGVRRCFAPQRTKLDDAVKVLLNAGADPNAGDGSHGTDARCQERKQRRAELQGPCWPPASDAIGVGQFRSRAAPLTPRRRAPVAQGADKDDAGSRQADPNRSDEQRLTPPDERRTIWRWSAGYCTGLLGGEAADHLYAVDKDGRRALHRAALCIHREPAVKVPLESHVY